MTIDDSVFHFYTMFYTVYSMLMQLIEVSLFYCIDYCCHILLTDDDLIIYYSDILQQGLMDAYMTINNTHCDIMSILLSRQKDKRVDCKVKLKY